MIKLKLNKKKLKNLSLDSRVIPSNITSKVSGASNANTIIVGPTASTRTTPK